MLRRAAHDEQAAVRKIERVSKLGTHFVLKAKRHTVPKIKEVIEVGIR